MKNQLRSESPEYSGSSRSFTQWGIGFLFGIAFLLNSSTLFGKFENFFPARDLTIKTPAFQGEEIEITNANRMYKYVAEIAKNNIHIDFFTLGKSPQGSMIPYMMITEKGAINQGYDPKKLTIWIQAMQHGDEPASGEAALNIIGFLATDEGKKLLKDLNVIIVPRANMDGGERGERFNNGVDMNMDHMKLTLPGTKGVKRAVLKYEPEIFIDLHEYPASLQDFSRLPGRTIVPYYDILTYKSVNINTAPEISKLADEIIENLERDLYRSGVSTNFYYNSLKKHGDESIILELPTGQSGAFRNAYGIYTGVSILIEGRGRGMGTENYQRRVADLADSVKSIMRYAAAEKNRIKNQVRLAKESGKSEKPGNIYVLGGAKESDGEYKFIVADEERLEDFKVKFVSNTNQENALVRTIPEGYIVSGKNIEAKNLLDLHGITYQILTKATSVKVERYLKHDGKYSVVTGQESALPGDIFIPTKQPQKTIVALLLEPDGLESFVTHRIIEEREGDIPIRRVLEIPNEMK